MNAKDQDDFGFFNPDNMTKEEKMVFEKQLVKLGISQDDINEFENYCS